MGQWGAFWVEDGNLFQRSWSPAVIAGLGLFGLLCGLRWGSGVVGRGPSLLRGLDR